MVELKNPEAVVRIDPVGAELKSFVSGGREYIWQANPEVWDGACPLIFPICGGLKDDKYILNGKEYHLMKHGFARFKTFALEQSSDTTAVFVLHEDEETLGMFPYAFTLKVEYTLNGKALTIGYRLENNNENTMYFSIGSHEGYSTPEGVENYDVIFPQNETLKAYLLDGNLLEDHTVPIIKDSPVIALYDKYFTVDALVFKDLKSRSATLRNRTTGKAVRVDFPGADYFLLWHKHGGGYICLEPWCGVQDSVHSDYDITKKEGIQTLSGKETFYREHTITVLE